MPTLTCSDLLTAYRFHRISILRWTDGRGCSEKHFQGKSDQFPFWKSHSIFFLDSAKTWQDLEAERTNMIQQVIFVETSWYRICPKKPLEKWNRFMKLRSLWDIVIESLINFKQPLQLHASLVNKLLFKPHVQTLPTFTDDWRSIQGESLRSFPVPGNCFSLLYIDL